MSQCFHVTIKYFKRKYGDHLLFSPEKKTTASNTDKRRTSPRGRTWFKSYLDINYIKNLHTIAKRARTTLPKPPTDNVCDF